MAHAVVFGGTGQLGVATAEHLLTQGWGLTLVTRGGRMPPDSLVHAGITVIDGTGRSRASIIRASVEPVDAVFDSTAYGEDDARDLLSVRDLYGALVVVSSASVYVDAQGRSLIEAAQTGSPRFAGAIDESNPTLAAGSQSYSTRKVAMENALRASGAPVSILRPCAIYGMHAAHPREWWFIKRLLDGRPTIPVAHGARSVFHTSSARGIASLAALCMAMPGARTLNVADPAPLSVKQIGAVIAEVTRMPLAIVPFEGPSIGPSCVGESPWSIDGSFVVDTSRATALGWDGGGEYRQRVEEVCRWVIDIAREGDWRDQFTMFARYGYDPFDYEAEDAVLSSSR